MMTVRRTLVLAAGLTILTFVPAGAMLAPTALGQTMGQYDATASSAGSVGSSIGSDTSVGSSIGSDTSGGGEMNMGVATGALHPDVVTGQGAPHTIIIGGGDTSRDNHRPTKDDAAGDDWVQVR